MRFGRPHQQAYDIQQKLINHMDSISCKAGEAAQLARAWVELEWFKRELRGLPRLKASDLITGMKRLPIKSHAQPEPTPTEIIASVEPSKESLKNSFSETVTAPPTPDAPLDGE